MKQWNGGHVGVQSHGSCTLFFCKKLCAAGHHSRCHQLCKFIATKESGYMWEFNSHRTCLRHQNGRPLQHGGRDAMWKSSIPWVKVILLSRNRVRWHMSAWKPTHTMRLPSDCSYAKDLRSSDLLPLNHLYMALFDVFLFFSSTGFIFPDSKWKRLSKQLSKGTFLSLMADNYYAEHAQSIRLTLTPNAGYALCLTLPKKKSRLSMCLCKLYDIFIQYPAKCGAGDI